MAVCVVCGERAVHRHHIVSRQALKRLTPDVAEQRRLIADERNLMWLCVAHHFRHESAFQRVPFSKLTQDALDFADELGVPHLLDRFYPKEIDHGSAA